MRGFFGVGLHHPRKPENVGSVLRLAMNFEAAFVAIAESKSMTLDHGANTTKSHRHLPVFRSGALVCPADCFLVMVEVDGETALPDFEHPERALYVFGPENGSLPEGLAVEGARGKYSVHIPTLRCLNLSHAVCCVLYDRMVKNENNNP